MIFQVLFLALANAIRPTSMAAVFALLNSPRPRRLMTVYVITGLLFSVGIGLLILWLFPDAAQATRGSTPVEVDLFIGMLLFIFGVGLGTRRVGGSRGEDLPAYEPKRLSLKGREPSVKLAAAAGPLTHLPGLFYLLALNAIAADNLTTAGGVVLVVLYCLIWSSIPIGALLTCIARPETARDGVARIDAWGRRHGRHVAVIVCIVVGLGLVLRAAIVLL